MDSMATCHTRNEGVYLCVCCVSVFMCCVKCLCYAQNIYDRVIEKFEIQGQSNKYDALQSCFNHYQQTENNQDENYAHIIHLLLQISQEPLKHNNGRKFRNLSSIIKEIESNKMDNQENVELSVAFMSKMAASQHLSEVTCSFKKIHIEIIYVLLCMLLIEMDTKQK